MTIKYRTNDPMTNHVIDMMLTLALSNDVTSIAIVTLSDTIYSYMRNWLISIVATYPKEFRNELSYWYEVYSDSGYLDGSRDNWDYKTYLLNACDDIIDLHSEYLEDDKTDTLWRNPLTFGEKMKYTKLIKYAKQLKSQIGA